MKFCSEQVTLDVFGTIIFEKIADAFYPICGLEVVECSTQAIGRGIRECTVPTGTSVPWGYGDGIIRINTILMSFRSYSSGLSQILESLPSLSFRLWASTWGPIWHIFLCHCPFEYVDFANVLYKVLSVETNVYFRHDSPFPPQDLSNLHDVIMNCPNQGVPLIRTVPLTNNFDLKYKIQKLTNAVVAYLVLA
jgi:hypothetical protein